MDYVDNDIIDSINLRVIDIYGKYKKTVFRFIKYENLDFLSRLSNIIGDEILRLTQNQIYVDTNIVFIDKLTQFYGLLVFKYIRLFPYEQSYDDIFRNLDTHIIRLYNDMISSQHAYKIKYIMMNLTIYDLVDFQRSDNNHEHNIAQFNIIPGVEISTDIPTRYSCITNFFTKTILYTDENSNEPKFITCPGLIIEIDENEFSNSNIFGRVFFSLDDHRNIYTYSLENNITADTNYFTDNTDSLEFFRAIFSVNNYILCVPISIRVITLGSNNFSSHKISLIITANNDPITNDDPITNNKQFTIKIFDSAALPTNKYTHIEVLQKINMLNLKQYDIQENGEFDSFCMYDAIIQNFFDAWVKKFPEQKIKFTGTIHNAKTFAPLQVNTKCSISGNGMCSLWTDFYYNIMLMNPNFSELDLQFMLASLPDDFREYLIKYVYTTIYSQAIKFDYIRLLDHFIAKNKSNMMGNYFVEKIIKNLLGYENPVNEKEKAIYSGMSHLLSRFDILSRKEINYFITMVYSLIYNYNKCKDYSDRKLNLFVNLHNEFNIDDSANYEQKLYEAISISEHEFINYIKREKEKMKYISRIH